MTVNHGVVGSSPTGGARKKHFERSAFFNDVCLRQMMLASPMMTASPNDVWLRHILLQTSHHCERSEQHHYAKHNFIWRSQTSLNLYCLLV